MEFGGLDADGLFEKLGWTKSPMKSASTIAQINERKRPMALELLDKARKKRNTL